MAQQIPAEPLVLTFDVGTQSARVVLIDRHGTVLDKEKKTYREPYYSLRPSWAEQDPDLYWSTMCQACQALKERQAGRWSQIVAVTCTCIRSTAVCLDREGRPLRDAIVWLDKRRAAPLPPMTARTTAMFKVAGLYPTIVTLREHMYCNWLALNEPELWARTYKFSMLSTYFNVRFTGVLKDSHANMCGTLPYDAKHRRWYPKHNFHRELYLIDNSKLIDLVEPGTVLGPITARAARETGLPEGLPYIVTGSDKMCETYGLSCTNSDTAAISLGTLSSIQVPSRRYFNLQTILPPFPSLTGDYLNEIQTYRGFWLVSWFKEQFGHQEIAQAERLGCPPEVLLDDHLKRVPPGCDGLIMQPTLTPDAVTPHARGVFLGITDVHTRMHFFRAIIEGIGFTLYDGLKSLEKAGRTQVRRAYIAGGGSNCADICQISADILGMPVIRIQTDEACGLGSSMLAFLTLGVYGTLEEVQSAMVHERDRFEPRPEFHKFYQRLYHQVYSKMFRRLVKLYRSLDHIILGQHPGRSLTNGEADDPVHHCPGAAEPPCGGRH